MKRILTVILAAAMLMGVYGCGKAKEQDETTNVVNKVYEDSNEGIPVVGTTVPMSETEPIETVAPKAEQTAAPEPAGPTIEPIVGSTEVKTVEADEVPTSETSAEFETTEVSDGYTRYVGGDTKWGIILPPDAVIGDEAEDSSLFLIGSNIVPVVIADKVTELTSVEAAKEYYEFLGEITIDDFTVIRENGEYKGCFFEYLTPDGVRGFAKYVVSNGKTVSAAGVNQTKNAAQDAIMRDVVNSVVIFE